MASAPYWDERDMIAHSERPEILAIGDSWFWYPFNNLLNPIFNLWNGKVILALGGNGAEMADYAGPRFRSEIAETLEAYADSIRLVLVSGGGNDIAGRGDFALLLRDDCRRAGSVAQCYAAGQPEGALDAIERACRSLVSRVRRTLPDAAIVLHNYDYAIPSGKGFMGMGNWLKEPMDEARVPFRLRTRLVNDLIDGLGERFSGLAATLDNVHFVNSAGTLRRAEWANELHPRPSGFDKLARLRWRPLLRELLPG